jgi:hypothetical protein
LTFQGAGQQKCRPARRFEGLPTMSFIDIFAWIVLIVVIATLVAAFVALGIMPGRIARKREHPWAQAVAVGGWATLICGFVFWPLVLIWAYVDVPAKREVDR